MTRSRSYTVFLRRGSLECTHVAILSNSNMTTSKTRRIRNDSRRTINSPSRHVTETLCCTNNKLDMIRLCSVIMYFQFDVQQLTGLLWLRLLLSRSSSSSTAWREASRCSFRMFTVCPDCSGKVIISYSLIDSGDIPRYFATVHQPAGRHRLKCFSGRCSVDRCLSVWARTSIFGAGPIKNIGRNLRWMPYGSQHRKLKHTPGQSKASSRSTNYHINV